MNRRVVVEIERIVVSGTSALGVDNKALHDGVIAEIQRQLHVSGVLTGLASHARARVSTTTDGDPSATPESPTPRLAASIADAMIGAVRS